MNTRTRIATLAVALLIAPPLSAHESDSHTHWWLELPKTWTWSAGAAVAQHRFDDFALDDGSFTSSSQDNSTGLRVFGSVGWRYVAIEAGYADLGKASWSAQSDGTGDFWNAGPTGGTLEVDGFDLSLVGRIPIGEAWALFGKAGYFRYEVESTFSGDSQCCGTGTFALGESRNGQLYGAGAESALGRWKLRLAYEVTEVTDAFGIFEDIGVDSLSLSAAYAW